MTHPVDVHVGARIRQRRFLLGMTQQVLAARLGVTFQQVQKYEVGANRVSASRLWDIARLLDVPIGFFFEGFAQARVQAAAVEEGPGPEPASRAGASAMGQAGARAAPSGAMAAALPVTPPADLTGTADRDAATLLRAFCAIPPAQRRRLLDLARVLSGGQS
jgi:transcriptional regulator with XRE-family HTH domain